MRQRQHQKQRQTPYAPQVTHKRLKDTLRSLAVSAGGQGPAAGLVDVLFGQREPRFHQQPPAWKPVNTGVHSGRLLSRATDDGPSQ